MSTRSPGPSQAASADAGKGCVAILLASVWSAGNIVHPGVLRRLREQGIDVQLFVRGGSTSSAFPDAAGCHPFLRVAQASGPLARLAGAVTARAFGRRNRVKSYRIYRRWRERRASLVRRIEDGCLEVLATLAQPTACFERLRRYSGVLDSRAADLQAVRVQLRAVAPDLLWSVGGVVRQRDRSYVLAARDLGIPVAASIQNLDTLTSYFISATYDHYLVWSETMRDRLLRLYPHVGSTRVTIAGAPRFDLHRRSSRFRSRRETLSGFGMPPDAHYYLYATSVSALAPDEPALVAELVARMRRDDLLRKAWLVVRLHPGEGSPRWEAVLGGAERVVLSPAWSAEPDADGWILSMPDDESGLVSSLRHAAACLNIASTITLDAAVLDRPVIGIEFGREASGPTEILYEEFYADHYVPLVRSGGLRLAHDWEELRGLMQCAMAHPTQDRERRAQMVRRECGVVDGHAADRVATAIRRLVEESRHRPPIAAPPRASGAAATGC